MDTQALWEMYARERQAGWTAKAKVAMREKARAGELPGRAPLGYVNRRQGNRTWVEVDQEVAPLIKEAFRLAAMKKWSLRKIITVLTAQGLRTQSGKLLEAISLLRILTNPFYAGVVRYEDNETCGTHEPIVTRELFERVQWALGRRRRRRLQ